MSDNKNNQLILDNLILLSKYIEKQVNNTTDKEKTSNKFRLTQIKKAIKNIALFKDEIISGSFAKDNIDGVGKGIADRIDEILETGTLTELKVSILVSEKDAIINELLTVHGIGEVKANKLYNDGIKSVSDLIKNKNKLDLPNDILIGLKYYAEFKERISYKEIEDLGKIMKTSIGKEYPELMVEICGSHRRKMPDSGDIDVLITSKKNTDYDYLQEIVTLLTNINFLVDDLAIGKTKYMGVCIHPKINKGRRIDIRFISYDDYYPALLYFTGSMELNKLMRTVALEQGYTLNEYGLYEYENGMKGKKIVVDSEKEIFDILQLKYLKPEDRNI